MYQECGKLQWDATSTVPMKVQVPGFLQCSLQGLGALKMLFSPAEGTELSPDNLPPEICVIQPGSALLPEVRPTQLQPAVKLPPFA